MVSSCNVLMLQYDYITVNTRPTHIHRPHGVSLKIRLKYMFTFFKKLSVPLTPCLLSESRFRGRTECGEARTGDMMAERKRGREREREREREAFHPLR